MILLFRTVLNLAESLLKSTEKNSSFWEKLQKPQVFGKIAKTSKFFEKIARNSSFGKKLRKSQGFGFVCIYSDLCFREI